MTPGDSRFEVRTLDLPLWLRCYWLSATAIVPLSHVALAEIWAWAGLTHSLLRCRTITTLTTMLGRWSWQCRLCLGSASVRCDLANRRNASRWRGWLLPGCAADELRVSGSPVSFLRNWALAEVAPPWFWLIWGDLRWEGPISAYAAATSYRLGRQSFCWASCGPKYATPPVRKLGRVGRETWAIAGRQINGDLGRSSIRGHCILERVGSDDWGLHEDPRHSMLQPAGQHVPCSSTRLSRDLPWFERR